MPRPRNNELKGKIEHAAWKLFHEQGYDATSYSAIANACGISRNLVQYHYPRKELLAIAFMELALNKAQDALGLDAEDLYDDYSLIYAVGTCYFEFLLDEKGYRAFLLDVLKSRDLTETVLSFNGEWARAHVNIPAEVAHDESVVQSVVVHMGGFYEYLYYCLKTERPIDPCTELKPVMDAFMTSLGYTQEQAGTLLKSHFPIRSRIEDAVTVMNNSMPV